MIFFDEVPKDISETELNRRMKEMMDGTHYDCCLCNGTTQYLSLCVPHEGEEAFGVPSSPDRKIIIIYALCQSCRNRASLERVELEFIRQRN